jgi:hypothetical protein
MNTNNVFGSPQGMVLHGLACGVSLALAVLVMVLSLHAITLRVLTVENLRAWCTQSGACARAPAYFGSTALSVYSDKVEEAQMNIDRLVRAPLTSLLSTPPPTITAVPRLAKSRASLPSGRLSKRKDTK